MAVELVVPAVRVVRGRIDAVVESTAEDATDC